MEFALTAFIFGSKMIQVNRNTSITNSRCFLRFRFSCFRCLLTVSCWSGTRVDISLTDTVYVLCLTSFSCFLYLCVCVVCLFQGQSSPDFLLFCCTPVRYCWLLTWLLMASLSVSYLEWRLYFTALVSRIPTSAWSLAFHFKPAASPVLFY